MMRKRIAVIFVLTVLLLAAVGCEAQLTLTESGAEAKGDACFYDESSGTVITNLSDKFDFKIAQWELSPEEETGQERLLFDVTIKNKTKTRLNHFDCDILFDETAMALFVTGKTTYDHNQPVDLIPDVTTNGASYAVNLSVNTDEEIKQADADKNELLEKVRYVTLKLTWDGGEETVLIICDALNKADSNVDLLTTDDLVEIVLSPANGSGGIRTMTLHYMQNGEEKSDTLADISLLVCDGYNDDNGREQTLTASDDNQDGIVQFIVYREFWFPDWSLTHVEIPRWPTVYENDMNQGFVIASAKYSEYFKTYAKTLNDQLDKGEYYTSDLAILGVKRLIAAADRIADGSFAPVSPYANNYYEDVFELTKEIKG